MKQGIHPEYGPIKVRCSCGHEFTTGSTYYTELHPKKDAKKESKKGSKAANEEHLHIDMCSNCHPFYTGKQRLIDSSGRVEKFQKKFQKLGTRTKTAGKEEGAAGG